MLFDGALVAYLSKSFFFDDLGDIAAFGYQSGQDFVFNRSGAYLTRRCGIYDVFYILGGEARLAEIEIVVS